MDDVNKERKHFEVPPFERFSCCPKSDQELSWWADKLLEWARRDDSIVLHSFAAEMEIDPARLSDWSKRSEKLTRAVKAAKTIVGARREKLALENKINASVVLKLMANYNEDYYAYEKEMKLLGSEEEKKAQTINVIMPPMPSTNAVPKKKKTKAHD